MSGLRREFKDIIELYEYSSLKKLDHLTTKVESKILKKTTFKNTHNDDIYKSSWKDKTLQENLKLHTNNIPIKIRM